MKTKLILKSLLLTILCPIQVAVLCAHESNYLHAHVGGALSHPPHTFFITSWYRDIVFDESVKDTSQTSLDIYVNEPVKKPAPVMVWVHGGGYMAGDKGHSKELDPKPEFFNTRMGFVFVSTNYRLMPEGRYPHALQDLAKALAWVADNIGEFGGDPGQIYLMGHSAGANLAAEVATNERFLQAAGKDLGLIKGVILVDGNAYDLEESDLNDRSRAYYGDHWNQAQPVRHIAKDKGIPPFLLLHVAGGSELGTNSEQQALAMTDALKSAGIRADRVALDGVEHFGANERIGEPGDMATISVEKFLISLPGEKPTPSWSPAP